MKATERLARDIAKTAERLDARMTRIERMELGREIAATRAELSKALRPWSPGA